jgi:hypothetical protein
MHSESMIEAKGFHNHDGASNLAGPPRRHQDRADHQARFRNGRAPCPRPETRIRLSGCGRQAHLLRRGGKQGKLETGRSRLRRRPRDRSPRHARQRLAMAVKNARAEAKSEAHYITPHAGGEGALRDAVEFILKAQGKWKRVVEDYIGEKCPKDSHPPKTKKTSRQP